MNCLVIASDIGITAPGIVYSTLINEMSKYVDITLLTYGIHDNLDDKIKILKSKKHKFKSSTISKLSMKILGLDIIESISAKINIYTTDFSSINSIDLIISLTSFHNYESIEIARYLSRRYNLKWIIYSVDAIPAPLGWCNNDSFYRNTIAYISKRIKVSDGFFSSNNQMLEYQLNLLGSYDKLSGVVYTPIRNNVKAINTLKEIVFLYTGGLYGPRKIEVLLSAFKRFVEEYPNSKMIFVGSYYFEYSDLLKQLIASGNVEIKSYVSDLTSYYSCASVLLDINAYFDDDVFLSSKIINYLPLGKPIISLTGYNSPSRNIFTEDDSVIHCLHEENEIYNAMHESIAVNVNANKRKKYIEMFSKENIVRNFVDMITTNFNNL